MAINRNQTATTGAPLQASPQAPSPVAPAALPPLVPPAVQHVQDTGIEPGFIADLILKIVYFHSIIPAASIAEIATTCLGGDVYIPRALIVEGEIIRVFDEEYHHELDEPYAHVDRRWVRSRRPTVVAGGELTLASLDLMYSPRSKIYEAPLQLKANCGMFLIDDFGRQQCSASALLNRWIVPLEKRVDYLNLSTGTKIKVPFEELIVFATNLEPRDLVDEAFLRRLQYKVEVLPPTPEQFK